MKEVAIDSRGYALFVQDGDQGREYYSNEVGPGMMIWHTGLVSPEMLRLALEHEQAMVLKEQQARQPETMPIPGHDCPKCGTKLSEKPAMFYWRGRTFPGLVCTNCNALWDINDQFIKHALATCSDTDPPEKIDD